MHRSGTSALSGVLNLLGVDLGRNLMPPRDFNPKGFFENSLVTRFNDKLLKRLGSAWDDPSLLHSAWDDFCFTSDLSEELNEIFTKEFHGRAPIGLKDPRICILLPWWKRFFANNRMNPHYIIVVRHPLEVAASLSKRSEAKIKNINVSLLLWLKYVLEAEFHTRGASRCFLAFNDLLSDTAETLARISLELDVDFPTSLSAGMPEVCRFLEKDLKHHDSQTEPQIDSFFPAVAHCYDVLRKMTRADYVESPSILHDLDCCRKQYSDLCTWSGFVHESGEKGGISQLFVDTGEGFNEEEKIISETVFKHTFHYVRFDLQPFSAIHRLRFDPFEGHIGKFKLLEVMTDGTYAGIEQSNCSFEEDGWLEFFTDDPCLTFKGDFSNATYFALSFMQESLFDEEITQRFSEVSHCLLEKSVEVAHVRSELADMRDSWSWRLTNPIRKLHRYLIRSRG